MNLILITTIVAYVLGLLATAKGLYHACRPSKVPLCGKDRHSMRDAYYNSYNYMWQDADGHYRKCFHSPSGLWGGGPASAVALSTVLGVLWPAALSVGIVVGAGWALVKSWTWFLRVGGKPTQAELKVMHDLATAQRQQDLKRAESELADATAALEGEVVSHRSSGCDWWSSQSYPSAALKVPDV